MNETMIKKMNRKHHITTNNMTSVVGDKGFHSIDSSSGQHLPDDFSVLISDIRCLPDIGSAQESSGYGDIENRRSSNTLLTMGRTIIVYW